MKRVWLVLPDQLDPHLLRRRYRRRAPRSARPELVALFLVSREEAEEWSRRMDGAPVLYGDELAAPSGNRIAARVDAWLDRQIGYHPLAIRLNRRHGFHVERMHAGHPNWMLDSDRGGPLPHWRPSSGRCSVGTSALIDTCLVGSSRRWSECSALVPSNVQPHAAVPFLVAARRLGLPVVAHVASWDHTVGKGVISPNCDVYVVQNRVMEDDLRRYHDIGPERVRVTGWPQTDIFRRSRPRADYEALLRRYGLDPGRPLVLCMGNTPTNAPYEDRFVERLLSWWEESARERFSSSSSSSTRPRVARALRRARRRETRCLRARAELHGPRGAQSSSSTGMPWS